MKVVAASASTVSDIFKCQYKNTCFLISIPKCHKQSDNQECNPKLLKSILDPGKKTVFSLYSQHFQSSHTTVYCSLIYIPSIHFQPWQYYFDSVEKVQLGCCQGEVFPKGTWGVEGGKIFKYTGAAEY